MHTMKTEIIIERRYRGPTTSGNGGYACGLLAGYLDGVIEVTLKAPPPLETSLTVSLTGNEARLLEGEREIASARRVTAETPALEPPSLLEATAAAERYAGFQQHLFPECFVCGPARRENDGLRIFAGTHTSERYVAAPWTPDLSLADPAGLVRSEFIWAALDCPGYFGLMRPGLAAVLGRMTTEIASELEPGQACVVLGWPLAVTGRKHYSGTALYAADGRLIGKAQTTWVAVDPDKFNSEHT